ncbi:MAG: hypothetical protein ACYDH6_02505 [Acidimicrobiales bacterium]
MPNLVDRGIQAALRQGVRRGVRDGSKVWLSIGAVALGVRMIRWMAGPGQPVIVSETLAPGDTLVIRHLSPPD